MHCSPSLARTYLCGSKTTSDPTTTTLCGASSDSHGAIRVRYAVWSLCATVPDAHTRPCWFLLTACCSRFHLCGCCPPPLTASAGVTAGVYTSESQWQPIFGSSYTGGSAFPLWYAHYGTKQFVFLGLGCVPPPPPLITSWYCKQLLSPQKSGLLCCGVVQSRSASPLLQPICCCLTFLALLCRRTARLQRLHSLQRVVQAIHQGTFPSLLLDSRRAAELHCPCIYPL